MENNDCLTTVELLVLIPAAEYLLEVQNSSKHFSGSSLFLIWPTGVRNLDSRESDSFYCAVITLFPELSTICFRIIGFIMKCHQPQDYRHQRQF